MLLSRCERESRERHNVVLDAGGSENESVLIAVHDGQVPGVGEQRSTTARTEPQHRRRLRRGGWSVNLRA